MSANSRHYNAASDLAAEMLAEAFTHCDPRTASEADIKACCDRFTASWTAAGSAAIPIYLAALFAPAEVQA